MKRPFLTSIAVALGLALLTGTLSQVYAQTPMPTPVKEKNHFAIIYRPGSAWIKGKSFYDQPLMAHANYMTQLLDQKKLVMGGPFSDDAGGLVILEAADMTEAKDILAHDPAVKTKVFTATVHPWYVVFQRK